MKKIIVKKGGTGSGHHGHPGLSGVWGGSRSSGADKGGAGGGKPSKKKVSKPKAKPKAKTGYEPDQNMRDYAYFQEHGHYPGEKKPETGYEEDQNMRDYAYYEEHGVYPDGSKPKRITSKPKAKPRKVLSEEDLINMGASRIGSGHIDFYEAADFGVGTISKAEFTGTKIGADLDTYYLGNKVTGIVTKIEDEFYTVRIDEEGYDGHGDIVKFQYYPSEEKEFIEEKCSTPKKKKFGDDIIASSEKNKKKDEDEEEED